MHTPLDAELYVRLSPLTDSDHRQIIRNKSNPLQRIKVSFNTQLAAIASYVLTRMANNSSLTAELTVQRFQKFIQVPLSLTISELMLLTSMNEEAQIFYSLKQNIVNNSNNNFLNHMQPNCNGYINNGNNSNNGNNIDNFANNIFGFKSNDINESLPMMINSPFSSSSSSSSPSSSSSSSMSSPEIFHCNSNNNSNYNSNNNNNIKSHLSYHPISNNCNHPYNNSNHPSPNNNCSNNNNNSNNNSSNNYYNHNYSQSNWSEVPTSPSCKLFHTGISMYAESFGSMPPSLGGFGVQCCRNERNENIHFDQTKESVQLKQQLEAMINNSRHLGTA